MNERIKLIRHGEKEIISVDFSGLSIKDISLIADCIKDAKAMIANHPPKSVLVISNFTGTGFNKEIAELVKSYTVANTPFIKASAIVGLAGMQRAIFNTIKALTKRDFQLVDTEEDAVAWLISQ